MLCYGGLQRISGRMRLKHETEPPPRAESCRIAGLPQGGAPAGGRRGCEFQQLRPTGGRALAARYRRAESAPSLEGIAPAGAALEVLCARNRGREANLVARPPNSGGSPAPYGLGRRR